MKATNIILLILVFFIVVGFNDMHTAGYSDHKYFQVGYSYRNEKFIAGDIPAGHSLVTIDSVAIFGDSAISYYASKGVTAKGVHATVNGQFLYYNGDLIIDPLSLADEADRLGHLTVQSSLPIRYPIMMDIGDTLFPWRLHVTVTEDWGGKMILKLDGKTRTCVARDTLQVSNRRLFTYVVECNIVTAVKAGSKTESIVNTRMREWISPIYGILRTETYEYATLMRYSTVSGLTESR